MSRVVDEFRQFDRQRVTALHFGHDIRRFPFTARWNYPLPPFSVVREDGG